MCKLLNKKLKKQGFTYIELVVSILLVALIVGPICMSFITSRKIYSASEAIEKGTYYTEALMENIKQQLGEDIKLKRQKENIQIVAYPNEKIQTSIDSCLYSTAEKAYDKVPLEKLLVHLTALEIETYYETQRYAYEVAIWPVDELSEDEMRFTYNETQLLKAAKFYSDSAYQFNAEDNLESETRMTLDELKWQDDEKEIKMKEDDFNKQRVTLTIEGLEDARKFNEVSQLEAIRLKGNQIVIQKPSLVKNVKGQIEGLTYTITSPRKEVKNSAGTIEVNVNGLLRQVNKTRNEIENNEDIKTFTLRFINETDSEQTIRIIRDACENVDTLEAIDEKIKVSTLNCGGGKINIVRTNTSNIKKSFIIVIITRDKLPTMGKKGKVVKKMIDFYSRE